MDDSPRSAGRDTKRQHRLTAGEDADVARALMTRIAVLDILDALPVPRRTRGRPTGCGNSSNGSPAATR